MTKTKDQLDAENYADKVVAEMSALSDEEIMNTAAEEHRDTKTEASRIRQALLDAAVAHGKERLKAAQARLADEDAQKGNNENVVLSFEAKRAKLARMIAQNPQLTLAARQGEAMDEAEIDGYLADLAELGITDSTERDDT
ncbi:MAG: hypothetical protein HYX37_17440 [Rhizobiales bacterium]|nr:hypothetical protein [Hyphomicrobiales bacterium]